MQGQNSERTDLDLATHFPIEALLSTEDKKLILDAASLISSKVSMYSYVEIGSLLGGSLAPFLLDDLCHAVLSIDDRQRQQPDERGAIFNYAGITSETMLENLHNNLLDTTKLKIFDGSISKMLSQGELFDLALIDGEHTDEAVFRDFLYLQRIMKKDSIVMLHDSKLISKAIKMIMILLERDDPEFFFFKRAGSEMSCILQGRYVELGFEGCLGDRDEPESFFETAEKFVLCEKIRNLVTFHVDFCLNAPKVYKGY